MESEPDQYPLVVLVGLTASGKSVLSMELARRFDGEIICADSRTVYKGMDIGTAKPGKLEQTRIRHHLLDVVKPDERFTAADFKRLANEAIKDISARGKTPIMVGGTGLYIDAVLYDFTFSPTGSERDPTNPRHSKRGTSVPNRIRPNTLVIGLKIDREVLENHIRQRTQIMFDRGLSNEVKHLADKYGWQALGLQAIGYKEFQPCFDGKESLEDVKSNVVTHTLQYAKRQRAWFKRNKSIHWLDDPSNIVDLATTFLNK